MERKIGLVDYECGVDENDLPLGHTQKVLIEYKDLLPENICPIIFSSKSVLNKFDIISYSCMLPYQNQMKITKNIKYKIGLRIREWKNLKVVFKQGDTDVLWFINATSILYAFMYFHKKQNKKIVCTMFCQNYGRGIFSSISNYFFNKMVPTVDLLISSCPRYEFNNQNVVYVSDYFYSNKYEKYRNIEKKNQIVCLGTIDRRKQIHRVIPLLNEIGYKVLIAGSFVDSRYANEIVQISNSNITIINRYLEYDEYYKILGESRFCILPYDMKVYEGRTSGVLQEAIFLDTIPITYKKFLEYNDILGIAIEDLEEQGQDALKNIDLKKFVSEYSQYRMERYSFQKNKDRIQKELSKFYDK